MPKTITIEIPAEIEQVIIDQGTDLQSYFNQLLNGLVDRYRESRKNQAIADNATAITTDVETVQAGISITVV